MTKLLSAIQKGAWVQVTLLALVLVCSLVLVGNGCSSPNGASPATSGGTSSDLKQAVSAWNAPVGATVSGVTLYDGWQDLRYVSSPINLDGGWTDSVHISANGLSLYFAYSRFDFFKFMQSAGANKFINGPIRPGMAGEEFKVFRATLKSSGWDVSYSASNSADINIPEATPSTNAAEDILVFSKYVVSNSPAGYDGSIYYSTKDSKDQWVAPIALPSPINTQCVDDNPFIVGDLTNGVSLYFESTRIDLDGVNCGTKKRLYYSRFQDGVFSPIVQLQGLNPDIQAGEQDDQPFVTKDDQTLYWTMHRATTYGIYKAQRTGPIAFGPASPVALPTLVPPVSGKVIFIGEANIAVVPEGELLYMMCGVALNEANGNTYLDADNIRLRVCRAKRPRS